MQNVPPALRAQAARIIGGKTALLARVDAAAGDPTGATGAQMREAIAAKLDKLQEPPPAKQGKVGARSCACSDHSWWPVASISRGTT